MGVDLYRVGVDMHGAVYDAAIRNAEGQAPNAPDAMGELLATFGTFYRTLEATGVFFRLNNAGWQHALTLARAHGWTPRQPAGAYWGTTIESEEGEHIAKALDAAANALDAHDWRADKPNTMGDVFAAMGLANEDDAAAFWSRAPGRLHDLAAFARGGAFHVT